MTLHLARLALPCLFIAACSPSLAQQSPAPTALAAAPECAVRETGVIGPESPGMVEMKLAGPFLVTSIVPAVDPANPSLGGSLRWDSQDAWIPISALQGSFYVPPGETLSAQPNLSPWKTVYSGCRLN